MSNLLAYAAIGGAVVAPAVVARYTQLPPCQTIEGAAAAAAIKAAGGTPTCDPDKPVAHNSNPAADVLRDAWNALLPSGNPFIQSALGATKQALEDPIVLAAVVIAAAGVGFLAWRALAK
jgi:hypothetical protein